MHNFYPLKLTCFILFSMLSTLVGIIVLNLHIILQGGDIIMPISQV